MRRLAALGLAALVLTTALVALAAGPDAPAPAPPADAPLDVGALGRIEPASRAIRLAPPEGGPLAALLVAEGDRVAPDQLVGWLAPRPARQAAAREAEALLALARARREQVAAGAKVGLVSSAEAALVRAKAVLQNAAGELERAERLAREGVIGTTALETKRTAADVARAEVAAAQEELAAVAEVRRVDLAVQDAEVARAEAALARAEADVGLVELRAPPLASDATGAASVTSDARWTVLEVRARAGEEPGASGALLLGDVDRLDVVAEVYETDAPRVALGMAAKVLVPGESTPARGRVVELGWTVRKNDVSALDPVAEVDARVVPVRVRLDDADARRLARRVHLRVQVVITTGLAR